MYGYIYQLLISYKFRVCSKHTKIHVKTLRLLCLIKDIKKGGRGNIISPGGEWIGLVILLINWWCN